MTELVQNPSLQAAVTVRGLHKAYGHVEALRGADLDVPHGAIVGLVGDNGAGKSTMLKILSGVESADAGSIAVRGQEVTIDSPAAARRQGIETVHQDLGLAPDLDAIGNLFLGRERCKGGIAGLVGWLDNTTMRREAEQTFTRLGVQIKDIGAPIASYSGGQRQGVAVARAAHWAHQLLLLDEPTAALGVVQTRQVLALIRRVRDSGVAVILVSHSMPDVLAVCDRVTVLRLGRRVADLSIADATTERLIAEMTGATAAQLAYPDGAL